MSTVLFVENPVLRSFRLKGKDAADLLHRLSTNDILAVKEGESVTTFLTTEKGKFVDLITLVRMKVDEFVGISRRNSVVRTIEWIERFIIMEEVTIGLEGSYTHTFVVFSNVAEIRRVKAWLESEFSNDKREGRRKLLTFEEVYGAAALLWVITDRDARSSVAESLRRGGVQSSEQEKLRDFHILSGIPQSEFELTDSINPLESGLYLYVSFTKGCYVGQEVIARTDTYKKLQKRLAAFYLPENVGIFPSRVETDGRESGIITGCAPHTHEGMAKALGYLYSGFEEENLTCTSSGRSIPITRYEPIVWKQQ